MSEPEISRRCPACGVAIRGYAAFCPQCGEKLGHPGDVSQLPEIATAERERDHVAAAPAVARAADAAVSEAAPAESSSAPVQSVAARSQPEGQVEAPSSVLVRGDGQAVAANRRESINAAEGNSPETPSPAPAIRGLRDSSKFVMTEAAADPGLRFVLVAAALFLVFVVFMVISTYFR